MTLRIFMMLVITGFILAPFLSHAEIPALSETNKETVQKMGLMFAQCSGIYAAVSEIHFATGAPNLGQSTKEVSNGAWLASAYLLFATGTIPDWKNAMQYAENTAASEKLNRLAGFEKKVDPNNAVSQLTDAMTVCNGLGKLQEELVQEARLKVYSKLPQKK